MTSINEYLKDPEYANWVKSSLALNITNEVLRPFVVKEITKLHQSIVKTLPPGVSCTGCNVNTRCPNSICDKIQHEIKNKHWYPNPSFTNTCTGRWSTEPWEIAKCYMPPSEGYGRSSASDADFSACINVVVNCKHFQAAGSSNPRGKKYDVSKSRDFRNWVMHESSQKVTENYMREHLDILIDILNMIETSDTEADTKEAKEKIEKIKTNQLNIKLKDVIEVRKDAIEAIADKGEKQSEQVQRERLLVNFEAGCRKALCRLTEEHISKQKGNMSVAAFLSKVEIFSVVKNLCSRHQEMLFPGYGSHADIREWDLFVYCFILEELDLYEPKGNAVSRFVREVKKIRNRLVLDASGVTQNELSELCKYLIDNDLNTEITDIFNKDSPDVDVIRSFNILGSWWREEEEFGNKQVSKEQFNNSKQIMEEVEKRMTEYRDTIRQEVLEILGDRGEHLKLQEVDAKLQEVDEAEIGAECEVNVLGCDKKTEEALQEHITNSNNNDTEKTKYLNNFCQKLNLKDVNVKEGSIILNVTCSSITNVLDFWDSCIDGRAVEALSDVRDYYRRYFKCDTLEFDVILTKKGVLRCVDEIVEGLPSRFEVLVDNVTFKVQQILKAKGSEQFAPLTSMPAEAFFRMPLTEDLPTRERCLEDLFPAFFRMPLTEDLPTRERGLEDLFPGLSAFFRMPLTEDLPTRERGLEDLFPDIQLTTGLGKYSMVVDDGSDILVKSEYPASNLPKSIDTRTEKERTKKKKQMKVLYKTSEESGFGDCEDSEDSEESVIPSLIPLDEFDIRTEEEMTMAGKQIKKFNIASAESGFVEGEDWEDSEESETLFLNLSKVFDIRTEEMTMTGKQIKDRPSSGLFTRDPMSSEHLSEKDVISKPQLKEPTTSKDGQAFGKKLKTFQTTQELSSVESDPETASTLYTKPEKKPVN